MDVGLALVGPCCLKLLLPLSDLVLRKVWFVCNVLSMVPCLFLVLPVGMCPNSWCRACGVLNLLPFVLKLQGLSSPYMCWLRPLGTLQPGVPGADVVSGGRVALFPLVTMLRLVSR